MAKRTIIKRDRRKTEEKQLAEVKALYKGKIGTVKDDEGNLIGFKVDGRHKRKSVIRAGVLWRQKDKEAFAAGNLAPEKLARVEAVATVQA